MPVLSALQFLLAFSAYLSVAPDLPVLPALPAGYLLVHDSGASKVFKGHYQRKQGFTNSESDKHPRSSAGPSEARCSGRAKRGAWAERSEAFWPSEARRNARAAQTKARGDLIRSDLAAATKRGLIFSGFVGTACPGLSAFDFGRGTSKEGFKWPYC